VAKGLTFSDDGQTADSQMRAVIFYLTTFGYIDGDFDDSEKKFVREYIAQLVTQRVEGAVSADDAALRRELTEKYTRHFLEVFEGIDHQVRELFHEAVAAAEKQDDFVHAKLKLRCFELFKSFDPDNRDKLMDAASALINADGQVHPAEAKFRAELADLLEEDLGVELIEDGSEKPPVSIHQETSPIPVVENHPFFDQFEHNYVAQPERLMQQVKADEALMDRYMAVVEQQRAAARQSLKGKQKVSELAGSDPFLDGHVYVCPTKPGEEYELVVVGDLHGCYSCLKAVLMQTDFFGKVARYRSAPGQHPNPKLVLLGDYIDRGMFSYQGVLRSALQLFVTAPDHVYVIRGNHEYYVEHEGKVYGAVRPSEAMNTLKPHLSQDVFAHYMRLFDSMPTSLLFERFLFVHGGLPRDLTLKEKYQDLSSLNDWDIRFQMMWSDPSSADVIPASLQEQSARFPFGRLQCQAFLQRIGCHTLIRGHEKVDEGFRRVYDDDNQLLVTVFSAGGATNFDLPADSSYRSVTPKALVIQFKDGDSKMTPLEIDYERYNDPSKNRFFQAPIEIQHRAD